MHEYAVVDELLAALLPRLEPISGDVTAVFVQKGELRVLSERALESAFELLSRGTRLEGARLVVEPVTAAVACAQCSYQGVPTYHQDEGWHFAIPILSCPLCGGGVSVVSGRELCVDRVAVKDSVPPDDVQ
jgi:hydrogenase nickel incorporation protein HypA/HybF